MTISNAIIFLGSLIFLAHLFNALFEYTKVPTVLLLILIGIVIGPITSIATTEDLGNFGSVFTTITLIVILFESGTGLRITALKTSIGSATLITITNFLLSSLAVTAILMLCTNFDVRTALYLGFTLGGTSSAVVIPMVKQLKLSNKSQTILFLESALSDVLCLVLGLAILQSIGSDAVSVSSIGLNILVSLTVAILFGTAIGFIWSYILQTFLSKLSNVMFTSFALAFILYGVCDILGFNGGIAVLAFGIVLGNLEFYSDRKFIQKIFKQNAVGISNSDRNFFSEIGFILQTYFFVYVGMSLKFGNIKLLAIGAVITLAIFGLRTLANRFLVSPKTPVFEKRIIGIMTPKGLVAAVLASIPLQMGLPYGEEIQSIAYAVVFFSILLCSILVIIEKYREKKEQKEAANMDSDHSTEEEHTVISTKEDGSQANESRSDDDSDAPVTIETISNNPEPEP